MKRILICAFTVFVFLSISDATANDEHSYSLSFWLRPWGEELRPGGAVLIGKHDIFDSEETTVEAWFKPISYATGMGQDQGRTLIWNGDGTGGHDPYWIYINQYGHLVAHVDFHSPYQNRVIKSDDPIELDEWHHFALVISLNETCLYLDGVKQLDVVLGAGSACRGTNWLALGRSMWHWNPYEGLIDEMRIWSIARTETEIVTNMFAGIIDGTEAGLICYWAFEPIIDDPSLLLDLSPNGIDGNIDGPIWFFENAPVALPEAIVIDIKPGSYPNSINLKSKGVIPVGVLTTYAFEASMVDPNTVLFAGAKPVRWALEDIYRDGFIDMIFHFKTQELMLYKDSTEATLTGYTLDGFYFEGKDSVSIVPKSHK